VSVIFVTGAGTDIGKTYVSCALLTALRDRGQPVAALKPVVSGVAAADHPGFDASDTARLLRAAGAPATPDVVEACSPWRFTAPLSPDMAAAKEGRSLGLADVVAWCRRRIAETAPGTLILIEGVGGVMSPIAEDGLVLDLILALGCPAVLVAGSYLGAISHALTALAVLEGRGLEVAALVVNETDGATVTLDATAAALAKYARTVPIHTLGRNGVAPAALIGTLTSAAGRGITESRVLRPCNPI
jgi:dethiobiotin synthetase